ncbi:histidine kinase [Mitsuaria sp. GD03876]|uniref:sensor histidine kinase n=1 Tax=Mitsuaria sp. GD03876 TaxID=2975399 RepID=UPI00244B36A0|nr:histidine kinase [Mitsuaria sp. GD03876]MDH0866215.1 histidine kinase [Mitsuaria sp. GD03876]
MTASARPLTLAWWLKQLMVVSIIAVVISLALVAVLGQPLGSTLVYCFFISLCCSTCINGLRFALSALRRAVLRRLGRAPAEPADRDGWPGWPLMVVSLVLGTMVGYSLGVEIANAVTGLREHSLMSISLRRAVGVMVVSLIPGFAATGFFLHRHRLADAEARAETLRRQAAETQLRLLESQLEPHMLFNTLANLRVLIGLDAERAQAMLDHLIAFLRATLSASRAERHPLKDEFARLADYLALMQVRMGARLRFAFELPPALAEVAVPPLLLQPLVENAIKHGLEPHVGGGSLTVRAARDGDRLVLDVEDDGAGFDPAAAPTPGGGFGTTQVRERLAVACGPDAALDVRRRDGGGTIARIRLPMPTPFTPT